MTHDPRTTNRDPRSWYLIYTKPRQERTAKLNLDRQGYETYLPLKNERRRRQGGYVYSIDPMFSRYLFIHLNKVTDNWGPIRSTIGVTDIVRFAGQPTVVPDRLVNCIRANDNENGIQTTATQEFNGGNKVQIVEGPMNGYEGIFVGKTGKERAIVLLDVLGKSTYLELPEAQLELTSR
jgi:transcriptional antiterminator RfaH